MFHANARLNWGPAPPSRPQCSGPGAPSARRERPGMRVARASETRTSHHGSSASAIALGRRVPDCRTVQRKRPNGGFCNSSSVISGVSKSESSRSSM
jgi:hypothetical protein